MALTLEVMQEAVLNRLDDEDFQTEFLNNALNWAQWDITNGRNFNFLETSVTETLAINTNSVPYPTDLQELIGINVYSSTLPGYDITEYYMDYADFRALIVSNPAGAASNPLAWTTFGGKMLFTTPANVAYTITIDYIRTSPVVDGITVDVFDIPTQYQELLMIGAYMRIAKMEDDYDVSTDELSDYNRLLTKLIHVYTRNTGPRKKHVMRVNGR